MTLLRVVHTPDGKTEDAKTWDIEFQDLTVGEVIRLEELCDKFEPHIVAAISAGSRTDLLNLLYLWRQRTEPDLMWASIETLKARDLTFSNPKPEDSSDPKEVDADPPTETPTED